MNFNVPLLQIKIFNETIVLTPLNFYKIKLENEYRLAILYNLKYETDDKKKTYESIIPYYISDGGTNCFRANMLFPFVCIQDLSQTDCPQTNMDSSYHYTGLVYKYSTIKNLNISIITKAIEENLLAKYGFKTYDDFKNSNRIKNKNRQLSVGVESVLPRIENLLDFMLAISSERIINDYPLEQYRPNYNPELFDAYAPSVLLKRFGLSGPQDSFDFTKNFLSNKETKEFLEVYDEYRRGLLTFFRIMYQNFVHYEIFKTEFIKLESIDITLEDFNKLAEVKICNDTDIDSKKTLNADYYFLISERLNIMINKYIESILTRDKIEALAGQVPRSRPITFYDVSNPYPQSSGQLFIKERYTFLTFLKMFIIKTEYLHLRPMLPRIINEWSAQCKQKYLKYKQKYLQLKNSINEINL